MPPTPLPTHPPDSPAEAIKRRASQLGFDRVGIAPAARPRHAGFYLDWLQRGFAGAMEYLAREDAVERRVNPESVLPGVRSIIVVAANYNLADAGPTDEPSRPIIARYARGLDYHEVFEEKLAALADSLGELGDGDFLTRCYVDYGPVLERDHAQRAGLGWIGKNTVLIDPGLGSYLFLGEIFTDAELPPDAPFTPDHCGSCERCIDACPTGAIVGPRELDARLCISYLTIELRGPIPRELRTLIGNRIFGCDICQEVCPWNRDIPETAEPRFRPRNDAIGPDLPALMRLSDAEFRERFAHTPISRAKRRGFLRNVAVALGNWGDAAALPALIEALSDDEPLVRGHCAWSLGRIGGPDARAALQARMRREEDEWVREEIGLALDAETE